MGNGPNTTDALPENFKKRSLGEDVLYTKNIEITVETAISLGLVQLPGICLGLLGVFKSFQTHGLSWSGVWDSAKSLRLFFVPFFLVELLGVFSSEYIKECCTLRVDPEGKLVSKYDLLFFLGKEYKPEEKMLVLEAAKMFFGSVLQLCVQLYFMEISTEEIKVSQYLLVTWTLLMMSKTGHSLMTYTRKDQPEEEPSLKERAVLLLETFGDFLRWLPLIGSNIVLKLGTIHLCLLFFGWYSILVFLAMFLVNLLSALLATNTTVKTYFRHFQMDHRNLPQVTDERDQSRLGLAYWSYSNIFMMTRTVASMAPSNMSLAVLIQPLYCLLAIIFLCLFRSWNYLFSEVSTSEGWTRFRIGGENMATVFVVSGIMSLVFCFTICKIRRKTETQGPQIMPLSHPVLKLGFSDYSEVSQCEAVSQ